MKYYSVAEIDITDRSWLADYAENVTPVVERFGDGLLCMRYPGRPGGLQHRSGKKAIQAVLPRRISNQGRTDRAVHRRPS